MWTGRRRFTWGRWGFAEVERGGGGKLNESLLLSRAKPAMNVDNPYQLTTENRPGYLYIRVFKSGKPSLAEAREFIREIAAAAMSSGGRKIMVEIDVAETLSVADNYWLISEFRDLELHRFKIAVVNKKPEQQQVFQFADAAANNSGVRTRACISVEAAEEWLASSN